MKIHKNTEHCKGGLAPLRGHLIPDEETEGEREEGCDKPCHA